MSEKNFPRPCTLPKLVIFGAEKYALTFQELQ